LDNGKRVEVVHVTLGDDVKSGASLAYISDKKPAVERIDIPLVTPRKTGAKNPYTPYSLPAKRVSVCPSDLLARAGNTVTPLAVPGKTAVKNTNTSSAKAVAYGHSGDSTIIEATSAKSEDDDDDDDNDDDFEAALAVPDPHGEARLDFSSSIAYYNSRVYKAHAGKPKSEWTQEAYLPASRRGTITLKAPMKRKFGVISSFAPTFYPAPEDDLLHV
jgi:hypothetical protein